VQLVEIYERKGVAAKVIAGFEAHVRQRGLAGKKPGLCRRTDAPNSYGRLRRRYVYPFERKRTRFGRPGMAQAKLELALRDTGRCL
jgi:hypothetical protein